MGKATIYRHWPGRAELAVEVFFAATKAGLAFPTTGTAREDFRQQVHQVAAVLRGRAGPAMAAMVAGALTEPALARALGERWVAPGCAKAPRGCWPGSCARRSRSRPR